MYNKIGKLVKYEDDTFVVEAVQNSTFVLRYFYDYSDAPVTVYSNNIKEFKHNYLKTTFFFCECCHTEFQTDNQNYVYCKFCRGV